MFPIRFSRTFIHFLQRSIHTLPLRPHLITLQEYTPTEILSIVHRGLVIKNQFKSGNADKLSGLTLNGKTLALLFSKRSTRTRVSSESGWAHYGGHCLFLGQDDIQTSETLQDTARVVSSMVDLILARVGQHDEILTLQKHSSVPVINALSSKFHPLQILADLMTIYENMQLFNPGEELKPLDGLKIAWVGDSNNILNSLLVTLPRLNVNVSVATPTGYPVDEDIQEFAQKTATKCTVEIGNDPVKCVNGADFIITDTWVSMGQESEMKQRLADFSGFQFALKGQANPAWKFMHCLPRKPQEVSDEVFYNPERSLVFEEALNRKFSVMAVYEMLMKSSRNSL